MKYCFLILFLTFFIKGYGQKTDADTKAWKVVKKDSLPPKSSVIYEAVDENPEPPGGYAAFNKYMSDNIVYPDSAKKAGVQGRIFVSMVVTKDGSLTNVTVKKDNLGYGCAEEAVRVIKAMPKWKPGKMNGKPVDVKFVMPVTFKL